MFEDLQSVCNTNKNIWIAQTTTMAGLDEDSPNLMALSSSNFT